MHAPGDGKLPPGGLILAQSHDGAGRAEAGNDFGGVARPGGRQDGRGVQIHGCQTAGVSDCVTDTGYHGQQAALPEAAPIVDSLLRGGDGVNHSGQGLNGVLAGGRLAGEHDAGGAVEHGVGHVGHLGPGGTGIADHGVQHLGGGDDRQAGPDGGLDHLLLEDGHLVGGDLHAQIAPGHHDAVGGGDDALQVLNALPVLDLGDDADIVAAVLAQFGADVLHVAGLAHEGGGDEVEVVVHGELQILPVLVGEGGQQNVHIRYVNGLVAGQGAAVFHLTVDLVALYLLDPQLDEAVVHQDAAAGPHLLVEVGIGDTHPAAVAGHVIGGQDKSLALLQSHGAVGKGLYTDFGALGVQNGGHGGAQGVPHLLEHIQPGQLLGVAAMGEVEAGSVHAGPDQPFNGLRMIHRRPQGADDFGLSHVHTIVPPSGIRISRSQQKSADIIHHPAPFGKGEMG